MTPRFLTILKWPLLRLGDVHVHSNVMLTGHHFSGTARSLGDLCVVQRLDDIVLLSEPASFTAASQSLRPRYRPEHALPAVNLALPG